MYYVFHDEYNTAHFYSRYIRYENTVNHAIHVRHMAGAR